jgi:hypothetical protein
MTTLQMMSNISEKPDLLQFQPYQWHPVMQKKHLENTEKLSLKDGSVAGGGGHILRKLTSNSRKICNCQNFGSLFQHLLWN